MKIHGLLHAVYIGHDSTPTAATLPRRSRERRGKAESRERGGYLAIL
jgi:hypothetical protein